ncbi:hypothetical protein, partial [Alkalicoccus chagannorensis]|uniref:hypothetical protein n=1 Tax=Alkalicoccus chagannorensis TaxID=427072 RepID=UPI001FDFD746
SKSFIGNTMVSGFITEGWKPDGFNGRTAVRQRPLNCPPASSAGSSTVSALKMEKSIPRFTLNTLSKHFSAPGRNLFFGVEIR